MKRRRALIVSKEDRDDYEEDLRDPDKGVFDQTAIHITATTRAAEASSFERVCQNRYSRSTRHSGEYVTRSAPASRKYNAQKALMVFHAWGLRPAGDAPKT